MKLLCIQVLILLFIFVSKIYCATRNLKDKINNQKKTSLNGLLWKGGSYGKGDTALKGK